ncbi:MAG: zinc ribbon domain-containing protein [Candidatus Bathyarchaeota archaeon]|nr:zinc ribbon domain-containing protein [Candidatus Bathyarchaeota archaeon]
MSKDSKYCPKCGIAVEEGLSFCPQCGNSLKQIDSEPEIQKIGVSDNVVHEQSRGAVEHLTIGYNVALSNPMVFVPTLLSGIIGVLVSYILTTLSVTGILFTVLQLSSMIISFILGFASTDMSRDAYYKQPLDISSSINYVIGRIVPFILASIFGALLSITVVLIPAVMLTFVIMVIDETGIMDAFSKAFNVLKVDLMDIIIVLIVSIVGSVIIGYVPFVSTLLSSVFNVIIGLAFIDIYINYKNK